MRALGLGTVVILGVAVSALLDEQSGVPIWLELRESLAVSHARVALLEAENDALRSEIELLETEPASLERAIREELDLALPGETIVYFRRSAGGLARLTERDRSRSAAAGDRSPSEGEGEESK